jgi:hypothetical protein
MKPDPLFTDEEWDELLAPMADAFADYIEAEAACMASAEGGV